VTKAADFSSATTAQSGTFRCRIIATIASGNKWDGVRQELELFESHAATAPPLSLLSHSFLFVFLSCSPLHATQQPSSFCCPSLISASRSAPSDPFSYRVTFAMAERILMNEFKALAKEQWVNIEVSSSHRPRDTTNPRLINSSAAPKRGHLQLDHRAYRPQPRFSILRRLLQGSHGVPLKLPILATKYAHIPSRVDTVTQIH
jgi:hypothetical protein